MCVNTPRSSSSVAFFSVNGLTGEGPRCLEPSAWLEDLWPDLWRGRV